MNLEREQIRVVSICVSLRVDSVLNFSVDGAGLACGVFEHFLSLGDHKPKVLGATHFHEIFENGFLKARPSLAFGYMEVRLDQEAEDLENQITYLYKYEQISSAKIVLRLIAAFDTDVAPPATAAGEAFLLHLVSWR